ncbi:MAG TPA: SRPBCC family protein [Chitinophagaceae bacterium]|nr:SRPBCC family protein [Chitinophagaceae bacterium]
MKKVLKIIGIVLLLAIAFVLIAGIFVPKTFHLEKDITINAPQEKVWSHVNSLQELEKWSPWTDIAPAINVTHEGQKGAIGSVYRWEGNKDVGSGNQTITKIQQPERVETHLHFIKPFKGEADSFIQLAAAGSGTNVTWGFDTKYSYPMNVMQLFVDMDEMMGNQYNKGLSKLKTISESN